MKRRTFLHTAAIAGAGIGISNLVSCSSADNSYKELKNISSDEALTKQYFPQSVLSAEPRANSVVVWTRVEGDKAAKSLVLQVSLDPSFDKLAVQFETQALSENDSCVSIKVQGLESFTHYYYRFIYIEGNSNIASRVGRTKTAPADSEQKNLKFAQVCCQDYVGRYYNSYWKLIEQDDLDFVLFLGDYIYETTRDPRFQTDEGRTVSFSDQKGAIQLGSEEAPFYAARSLDNYRELYKIYRSDPLLQKVHERFPMIAIWDDHEFADDSFGANSTHYAGRRSEEDIERKLNSEHAFFEYMPIDLEVDTEAVSNALIRDDSNSFPNTQIYRNFKFGKNLDLVVSDFRSYRPDHLIPEDAFPGTIIFNETALEFMLFTQGVNFAEIKQYFSPYIDIDVGTFSAIKKSLKEALYNQYLAEGLSIESAEKVVTDKLTGNLSIRVINQYLDEGNQIDNSQAAGIGFSYDLLGKLSLFGEVGSRYFIVKQAYDLLSSATYTFNKKSQDALGKRQELWLKDKLLSSEASWKIMANSVAMNSLLLDLRPKELQVPPPLNQYFYMNVDHWDGFPNKRQELLDSFSSIDNMILLSGDIHAALVGSHGENIKEFTAPSLASSTQKKMIGDVSKRNSVIAMISNLDSLLEKANELILKANSKLEFAEMTQNGLVIHELNNDELVTHYHLIPEKFTSQSYYDSKEKVLKAMTQKTFRTKVANK